MTGAGFTPHESLNAPQDEAFAIRAHHVTLLLQAGVQPLGSILTAADMVNKAEQLRGGATMDTVDFSTLTGDGDGDAYEQAYAVDLIGDTPVQREGFYLGIHAELDRFQSLEDDKEVRLNVGVLDGICNSCAFKQHCVTKHGLEQDGQAITTIQKVGAHMGLEDELVPNDGEGLTTNVETLIKIMNYFVSIDSDYPEEVFRHAYLTPDFDPAFYRNQ